MPTAILIDGAFFLKRLHRLKGRKTPAEVAAFVSEMARRHLSPKQHPNSNNETNQPNSRLRKDELYRIFFYDCPPLNKKSHNPIANRTIDFSKTEEAKFRNELHAELKKQRKLALRLGDLASNATWSITPSATKSLLNRKMTLDDLTQDDVIFDIRQKGVDMKIGIDIASLAYKKQVDKIILIAGDSDFVPAAKLARREGIDFVLDPMWQTIRPDLHEHIDGLRSVIPKPKPRSKNSSSSLRGILATPNNS
ncbi:NYN domain-containing protein [Myxococcota bacterium]|nr:NYN domain-containing protein [Myxococcota bacterium]